MVRKRSPVQIRLRAPAKSPFGRGFPKGLVHFRTVPGGVLVTATMTGLKEPGNPFPAGRDHWNPDGQFHGDHAGNFPVRVWNWRESLAGD